MITSAVVTGACGFIGSHLAEELVHRGTHVKALAFYDARGSQGWLDALPKDVSDSMEIISGDVRDVEQMRRIVSAEDTVFHLAALIGIPYSYQAPRSYVETNINGTINMLEAVRAADARRLLFMSTSEVYGTAMRVPIDENHPLQGQSPYSASKIGAEKMVESYYKAFQCPVVTARAFNTFGPRQSARAVIPTILMQLMAGKKSIQLGNLDATRDFNYVLDTVEGLIRLAECPDAVGQVANIGTGVEITIENLVHLAAEITGTHPHIDGNCENRTRPAASEVQRLCADNKRLHSLTGWTPPHRLQEGLDATAHWLVKNKSIYDPDRYYV